MTVRVYPGAKNPSHEISLSDGVLKWGLRLEGGPGALEEYALTPSTLQFTSGSSKFGDWEPGMAQIEQRSWEGGRGLEELADDSSSAPTRFYDSMNAWTLTPGRFMPGPQWHFAQGLRESYEHLPGDVGWQSLTGASRYLSASFTVGTSDFAAEKVYLWLRRKGSPGTLTVAIYSDDGEGNPDEPVPNRNDAVTVATAQDVISVFQAFGIAAASDLSAETTYHVVAYAADSDNVANHWELGVDRQEQASRASEDGEEWAATGCALYHRVVDADVKRKLHFFQLDGALYAVDQRADGSPSHLYMNGDRGVATAGTATTLSDSEKSWTEDQWLDAWVVIVGGTGKGQQRRIQANTATTLTVSAWDITPDDSSEYVITATEQWTDITPDSGDLIDGVVTDVAVFNDQAALAQGASVNILKMRFNADATPPAHEFDDDGTNKADLLYTFYEAESGVQVWRAQKDDATVSRATPTTWGTALTFGSAIEVGDASKAITNLLDYGNQLWVFKTDSLWQVAEDEARRLNLGLDTIPDLSNGATAVVHDATLYLSVGHTLGCLASGSLEDIGPWQGAGLPAERSGQIAALQSAGLDWLIAGIDAGEDGTSSILVWNGNGWHELLRGWESGRRVQSLTWQYCPDGHPRLWVGVGGELAWQAFPRNTLNPLQDTAFCYQHEAVLETASIDMGSARLPKFIREFSLTSLHLATGVEVHLDYQVDDEIGGNSWTTAKTFYKSPEDTLPVQVGGVRKIRLRLRLLTEEAIAPPVGVATVLEGFVRTPLKYQWTLRVRLADLQLDPAGGLSPSPDRFVAWLKQAAQQAKRLRMRSIWDELDDKYVIVEPPGLIRQFANPLENRWGGAITIRLREA